MVYWIVVYVRDYSLICTAGELDLLLNLHIKLNQWMVVIRKWESKHTSSFGSIGIVIDVYMSIAMAACDFGD